jgi:hypothetical protein
LTDADLVSHWLDTFTFNPEARIAHVLAMVAQSSSLALGEKVFLYDSGGFVQINRLSDILNTAIAQDPSRLGHDLDEFAQRFLFDPLGMRSSVWQDHLPDKLFGVGWSTNVHDMARLGLLILNGGVWNGRRLLDHEWIYRMTHPSFEDANTGYGYLTWLDANSNWASSGDQVGQKRQGPRDPCAPPALNAHYPHGVSDSSDCNYLPPYTCAQEFDDGVWFASGTGGHFIVGHPGLDMLLVAKDLDGSGPQLMWTAVRPALVALDPVFRGDEEAFCRAYGSNSYAPDLR